MPARKLFDLRLVVAVLVLGGLAVLLALFAQRNPDVVGLDPTDADTALQSVGPSVGAGLPTADGTTPAETRAPLDDPGLDPALDPDIRAALCGFRGRVVDHDGAPMPACAVALERFGLETVLTELQDDDGFPAAFDMVTSAGETATDERGRFELTGVWPNAFYLLVVGVRSARSRLVVVDQTPAPGEIVDLGDIRFDLTATITGVVVDERGAPLAGAVVRAADLPGAVTAFVPLESLDPSGSVIVTEEAMRRVFELPAYAERLFELLPIPATTSGADGSFLLTGVAAGDNLLAVTAPRRLSFVRPRLRLDAGEKRDVGEVTLGLGDEVYGRVLDHAGNPVAGAEVLVGQVSAFAPIAFAAPADPTNAKGEFALTGFRGGRVIAAARRPGDAWTVGDPDATAADLVVRLPGAFRLTLRVVDAARAPIRNARVRLYPDAIEQGMAPLTMFGIARPVDLNGRVKTDDDGGHVIDGLAAGRYRLEVSALDQAVATDTFDLSAHITRTVQLAPLSKGTVVVVNAAGTPLRAVAVWAGPRGDGGEDDMPAFCGRTGHDGKTQLRRCKAGPTKIMVAHPGYGFGYASAELPAEEIRVVLRAPGSVHGVLTQDGGPPELGKYTIVIAGGEGEEGELGTLPRLNVPDPKGHFAIEGLQPGRYTLVAIPSLRAVKSFGSIVKMFQATMLMTGEAPTTAEVEVISGQTAQARLEVRTALQPIEGPSALISGTVLLDGRPGAGLLVTTEAGRNRSAEVDANGRFELGQVEAGDVSLRVHDPADSASMFEPLWQKTFAVEADRTLDVLIDLSIGAIAGQVVDVDGNAAGRGAVRLEGVPVLPSGQPDDARVELLAVVDDAGAFRLDRVPAGTYRLQAMHEGGRGIATDVRVVAGGTNEQVVLRLQKTLKVAGRVDIAALGEPRPQWVWIELQSADGESESSSIDPENGTFAVDGLLPGHYEVEISAFRRTATNEDEWSGESSEFVHRGGLTVTDNVAGVVLKPEKKPDEHPDAGPKSDK